MNLTSGASAAIISQTTSVSGYNGGDPETTIATQAIALANPQVVLINFSVIWRIRMAGTGYVEVRIKDGSTVLNAHGGSGVPRVFAGGGDVTTSYNETLAVQLAAGNHTITVSYQDMDAVANMDQQAGALTIVQFLP